MQPLELQAAVEIRDRFHGIVRQIQVFQVLERRDGREVRDRIVRKVKVLEVRQADERIDGRDCAALQYELFELRQRADGVQRRGRKRRARKVKRLQRRELWKDREIEPRCILNRERFEAREAREIGNILHALRKGQLLKLPELIGHNRIGRGFSKELAHVAVQSAV